MIEPEAEIAAAITETGRVGVLATPATVEGGAYRRALGRQGRGLEVTEVAAPDLAPIIQSGFPFDESVVRTVRSYCEPLRAAGDRHADPRLHPLSAGRADAAAHARPRRPPGQRRARDRRLRSADPRVGRAREQRGRGGRLPLPLHRRRRDRSASSAPASCRCRSATWSASDASWRALTTLGPDERPHSRTDPGRHPHRHEGRRSRARRNAADDHQLAPAGREGGRRRRRRRAPARAQEARRGRRGLRVRRPAPIRRRPSAPRRR